MNIQERIRQLTSELSQGLYERDDVVSLALLCAVAGESIFLIGPPGVAKSMVARRLVGAFGKEATSFEYLMNRFSTPDEIFGPVSISELKSDNYRRLTDGYLPSATVVFLDELWKASPSIQNTLLTVLNEKVFRNGRETLRLPLQLLMAASNELPTEGEGLEALWDRFLVRLTVGAIERQDLFDKMLLAPQSSETPLDESLAIGIDELRLWRENIMSITVDDAILTAIHHLRSAIDEKVYVSDRRWHKAVGMLRCSAFLNGRNSVSLADLTLLIHLLWNEPSQQADVEKLVAEAITAALTDSIQLELNQERLDTMRDELKCANRYGTSVSGARPKVVHSFYHQIQHSSQRPILIFSNEYEALCDSGQVVPFIMQDDRKKTGAQILKKYEKSRHPGIFPKDILQVSASASAITVNGKSYPLIMDSTSTTKQEIQSKGAATEALLEALKRVCNQALQSSAEFEEKKKAMEADAQTHLFMNAQQHMVLRQALSATDYAISRMSNDARELCHTFKIEA